MPPTSPPRIAWKKKGIRAHAPGHPGRGAQGFRPPGRDPHDVRGDRRLGRGHARCDLLAFRRQDGAVLRDARTGSRAHDRPDRSCAVARRRLRPPGGGRALLARDSAGARERPRGAPDIPDHGLQMRIRRRARARARAAAPALLRARVQAHADLRAGTARRTVAGRTASVDGGARDLQFRDRPDAAVAARRQRLALAPGRSPADLRSPPRAPARRQGEESAEPLIYFRRDPTLNRRAAGCGPERLDRRCEEEYWTPKPRASAPVSATGSSNWVASRS